MSGVSINLDHDTTAALVRELLPVVVAELRKQESKLGPERIAYPIGEAAALCGMRTHCLREQIKAGTISASRVGRFLYVRRDELLKLFPQPDK